MSSLQHIAYEGNIYKLNHHQNIQIPNRSLIHIKIFHFYRLKRSKIRIILGDHDQHTNTDAVATMRAVSAIIRHRNFDINSYNHDLALLKLKRSVKFSNTVRPICLPQSSKIN